MNGNPSKSAVFCRHAYLLTALFIAGGTTLILEIVGARVLSPYYGASLYAWSALIVVTLVALMVGYKIGGRVSGACSAGLDSFARTLCLAGAAVALIPLLRVPVLEFTSPWGIRLGALAAAAVLLAPALILLSALVPLAIKLMTAELGAVGKKAGDVCAVSTLGSVLGAVLAGYVLIPHIGLSRIFFGLAAALSLSGCLGAALARARPPWLELALAAAVALLGMRPAVAHPSGVLFRTQSPHSLVQVIDIQGQRYLLADRTIQGMARLPGLESAMPSVSALELTALLRPKASRALVIGVGAGLLPGAFERFHGVTTDAVDVDPAMVSAARSYFNFSPRGEVFIEDARALLRRTSRRYGILVLDAFAAESPPHHLFTAEAFGAMRHALSPGGILAVNLAAIVEGPGDEAWLSAIKTLRFVFPEVRAYMAAPPHRGMTNVIFFCGDGPESTEGLVRSARPPIRKDLDYLLAHEIFPDQARLARARLLSDDHAPMESLLAETALRYRKSLEDYSQFFPLE